MILGSTTLEETLLVLKLAFLVLLYVFIWRIVRTVGRDMRLPQESFILKPQGPGVGMTVQTGKLVVEEGTNLKKGDEFPVDSTPLTIGRGGQNDVMLEGDEYASARHVRVDPRRDGVWVQDLGSTNGTYVNGIRIDGPRRLVNGDLVRVGETELRFVG